MGVAPGSVGEPYGDKQTTVAEANAVAGAGGDHFPVVFGTELFEGRGDVDRLGEGLPVVVAAHVVGQRVLDAKQEMQRTGFGVGDGNDVVVGDFAGLGQVLR